MKNKNVKFKINHYSFLSIVALNLFVAKTSLAISVNITNPIVTSDFSKLVENFLLWTLGVAGSVTLLMLVVGGVLYITSSGDEQKIATAKRMVTWTILGLMIVLASYAIIVVLGDIFT